MYHCIKIIVRKDQVPNARGAQGWHEEEWKSNINKNDNKAEERELMARGLKLSRKHTVMRNVFYVVATEKTCYVASW